MRKGLAEATISTVPLSVKALSDMQLRGYKYVQVKGLTHDKHYEYVDPHFMVLVPMRELPTDPNQRDIYEPLASELLLKWAREQVDNNMEIVIADKA
jgi:hypothetical protein